MPSAPSRDEALAFKRSAQRLLKARTPSVQEHRRYLVDARIYREMSDVTPATLRIHENQPLTVSLELRRSVLFGRRYLVAWFDDAAAFSRQLPDLDAAASPINLTWTDRPLPLVVAVKSRKRALGRSWTAIFEHEVVHVNQHLLGLPFPDYRVKSLDALMSHFFAGVQIEHEAHTIQYAHWPPERDPDAPPLPLDQWILLRAYTAAVEEILKQAIRKLLPESLLPRFVKLVPARASSRLSALGCSGLLIKWFQGRWRTDVGIAAQVVQSQGFDTRSVGRRLGL